MTAPERDSGFSFSIWNRPDLTPKWSELPALLLRPWDWRLRRWFYRKLSSGSGPLDHYYIRPRGWRGRLWARRVEKGVMERHRVEWTLDFLQVEPHHRILEIGFGTGLGLELCAERLEKGKVIGVDHSGLLIEMAQKKLATHFQNGKVELHQASVENLPELGTLDEIFSINSIGAWPEPKACLRELFRRLSPGGKLAITFQLPWFSPQHDSYPAYRDELLEAFRNLGLENVRCETEVFEGLFAACFLGEKAL